MDALKLSASKRTTVRKGINALRRAGLLPGVVYGTGIEAISIEMDGHIASKLLARASRSTLIELEVDDEPHTVLVRELQRDVIRGDYLHVDFLKVAMDVRIRASVPIELVGEAPAAQEAGGILVSGVTTIEVEALPADLTDRVSVELESLAKIDDSITVADLYLGENITILTDSDELVARVIYQEEEIIEEPVLEEELEEVLEGEEVEEGVVEEDAAEAEDAAESTEQSEG
jgi:large subunit ribosomal protein L25